MEAEFTYYTETDGNISFLRGGQISEDIAFFVRIRLDLAERSLVIPVPETIEGKPVTMIGIVPELPDDRPVPELPSPLIRRVSIPSRVRHIRIVTSITRDSKVSGGAENEKFNPLNGSIVEISPDNHKYCVFGHGIYSADMTRLYHIFSPGEIFSVPHGVRTINGGAGCAVKGLRKLIIPETVVEIGDSAFEGCTDLEEAKIHAKRVGSRAFYGCTSLTKLSAEGLETIHKDSFENCCGIGEILNDAFRVCAVPKKFRFRIDKNTKDFDLSLNCAQIIQPEHPEDEPDKHSILGSSLFLENSHLRKLALSNVETVCFCAFAKCEALDTLIVKNASGIGTFAFMSCYALHSAYLDCKELYDSAFNSCTSLEKVRLLNTEGIRGGVFSHCKALSDIKLPDTLRRLGDYAFYKTGIQRLRIPPGVEELGKELLSVGVIELVSVNGTLAPSCGDILHAGDPGVTLAVRCAETNEVLYELDLTYELTEIFTESGIDTEAYNRTVGDTGDLLAYNDAFFTARNELRRFNNTESGAFSPFKRYVSDLAALNILKMIAERDYDELCQYPYFDDIEDERFLDLTNYSAQQKATEFTALLMQRLHEKRTRGNNGQTLHSENDQNGFEVCNYEDLIKEDGTAVKKLVIRTKGNVYLHDDVFAKYNDIEELELECREIRWSRGSGHCDRSLKKLTVTNAETIHDGVFTNCKALTDAQLDCKHISEYAFARLENLMSVTLFNTREIGREAFDGCKSLKEIKLPETLCSIGDEAFYRSGISHLRIPPNVSKVGEEIIKEGMIEVCLKGGKLPFEHIESPGTTETLMIIRSPETDEIICQFVLLKSPYITFPDIVFTENGADLTEYDKLFMDPGVSYNYGYEPAAKAARARLRCPVGMSPETLEFFKKFVSECARFDLFLRIDDSAEELAEYPYFDDLSEEDFLSIIDCSAQKGKTEMTALLMQKLHEKRNSEHTDPSQGEF